MLLNSKITLAAVLVSSLVGMTNDAFAKDRRVEASSCFSSNSALRASHAGVINQGSATTSVFCPIASDSFLPHQRIARLSVHGRQDGASRARACVRNPDSTSIRCGSLRSFGSGGTGALNVDISTLKDIPNGFPFIEVTLGAGSKIYGIWYQD